MSHYKIIAIIGGIVLVLAGFLLLQKRNGEETLGKIALDFFTQSVNQEKNSEFEQIQSAPSSGSESVSDRRTYAHSTYKFSLEYPERLNVVEFDEEEGAHTILFQEREGGGGFQIFISEFDEPGPVTPERIRKDLPNLAVEQFQEITLGGRITALVFFSRDESLGRTREVWFVYGPNLYQVTAKADFDEELSKIMATYTSIEVELR